MRAGLMIVALVALFGLTGCGGDDEPLSGSDYRAAGNELCTAWADEISELANGLSDSPTQQELIDTANEIAEVADDYTKQLLDLNTPDSAAEDRAALQARFDEYEALTDTVPQTEAEVAAITSAGDAITDALGNLWSACRAR